MSELRVLAVDDEPPALDELAYLLRADPRVASVHTAGDATGALRLLRDLDIDAVFLDIRMPGLDGMELARVLTRFAKPPAVVFVTAYEERAVEAFELGVVDYVRKPVQAERLAESLRRVAAARPVPPPLVPRPTAPDHRAAPGRRGLRRRHRRPGAARLPPPHPGAQGPPGPRGQELEPLEDLAKVERQRERLVRPPALPRPDHRRLDVLPVTAVEREHGVPSILVDLPTA